MNATKRKFNALLQGLSTPRPSSADRGKDDMNASPRYGSSPASHDEILQKRRRLGFPESTAPTLYSSLPVTTSFSNVVLRRSAMPSSSTATRRASSRYCPSDRDELLRRLATFQEITDWTPKPDKINEIEWAKRGWICQDKEKVRCVLCHKELMVKLNRNEDDAARPSSALASSEIAETLVEKYFDLIVSSHQQDCLWRKRGCDDSLIRLSFSNTQTTLELLRQRYDELCSRSSSLPYEFNIRLPDDVSIDNVLSQLSPDFFTAAPPAMTYQPRAVVAADKPPNRAALALALMGWQGLTDSRIGAVSNSVSCHTCLRRLGLWMFKSKEVDEQGHVVVPALMDHLDPVREHRFFCPWKDAHIQSRSAASSNKQPPLTGWKMLMQTIKNESDLRNVYNNSSSSRKPRGFGHLRAGEAGSPSPLVGIPATPASHAPTTPTPKQSMPILSVASPQEPATGEEDENVREAKDKERWARLRKVKSLFDTKGSRKFRREVSRPGTGHSAKSPSGKQDV
ncbi:hypothetical protein E4U42_000818 [Claviceps africana]|uniref:Uncharacterized protein n=1 Tax=Claviceps africana TaxID=83212 RepID=A0A8K0NEL6_9HYPO|nr:hypothetical protein E4U42_000818 [Claviceps africana]